MDHENDSTGGGLPAVSRGQNQLHVLPQDWQAAADAIEPLLDRLDATTAGARMLIVASDADAAAGIAERIAPIAAGEGRALRTLAATDARRAARVQRSAPAHVIVGPAVVLVELVESVALKLDGVQVLVLAWVDELRAGDASTAALESLMSEAPKDAARIILAGAATPAVEQVVERYARRARRIQTLSSEQTGKAAVSLSYVVVADSARPAALRRLLDALDPESASVIARNRDSHAAVKALLGALGYTADSSVRLADAPDPNAQVIVLYDLPGNADDLRKFVGERGAGVVALVSPRQLSALRHLAGGAVTPFALPEAAARARGREDRLRDELRSVLSTGLFDRELLALEPLMSEYDGAEVAAAALRLLESERAKPQVPSVAAEQPAMTRLYVNVGEMDNVRPGDLVGAITNEAGISKSELGRVDVRERHSTVEVATPVANSVVSKLTGVSIKGRRALVKIDEDRGAGGRERGPRRDSRGDARRDRGAPPRDRGRDRRGP